MNKYVIKMNWNEIMAKARQKFADVVEDDIIFSEARELDLIKQLQQRLEQSKRLDPT